MTIHSSSNESYQCTDLEDFIKTSVQGKSLDFFDNSISRTVCFFFKELMTKNLHESPPFRFKTQPLTIINITLFLNIKTFSAKKGLACNMMFSRQALPYVPMHNYL